MKIRILGCDGGIGSGRRTTSLLIDDRILLDAGTGVADLSLRAMTRIEAVLLTHAHFDHVCSLPLLVETLLTRIDRPLPIHGLPATLEVLREHIFNWKLWPDFTELPSAASPRLAYQPMLPGETRSFDDFSAQSFPVLHTVPATGYALQTAAGGTFAFTGDTYASAEMWVALNALPRLDVLMIEVSFGDADAEIGRLSRHLTPALLGRELQGLRHRPDILLTHPKPGAEKRITQQCQLALEGWNYRHLKRGETLLI